MSFEDLCNRLDVAAAAAKVNQDALDVEELKILHQHIDTVVDDAGSNLSVVRAKHDTIRELKLRRLSLRHRVAAAVA